MSSGRIFCANVTRKGNGESVYIERCGVESRWSTPVGKVEKQRFHSLRHTAITKLFDANIREADIALVMGH
jgi:integrase